MYTLPHQTKYLHIKSLILSLTSSMYFTFLPLETPKKNQTDQSIPRVFLLCLKRNDSQTIKSGSCKKILFSNVYAIAITCFHECFLFYVIDGRHWLSWKFVVTLRFFEAPSCCFLWRQSFEVSPYFILYLHNDNAKVLE